MLKSQNEGGGFGYTAELTMRGEGSLSEKQAVDLRKKAADLFDQVGQMIKRETKASDAQVVEFLDSRQGRHLADQMVGRSGLRTSSLPAKFRKDYWDWWAKEQGIRLSDADDAPVQLADSGGVEAAFRAIKAIKEEARSIMSSGKVINLQHYNACSSALDQAAAFLGQARDALWKLRGSATPKLSQMSDDAPGIVSDLARRHPSLIKQDAV